MDEEREGEWEGKKGMEGTWEGGGERGKTRELWGGGGVGGC